MKITQKQSVKRASGMTLLELTVVILVLLSLISVLFVGARAWKKGSDRAACVLNIRNAQQAVRGYANMNNINEGGSFTESDVFGAGKVMNNTVADLKCPQEGAGAYSAAASGVVPNVGVLYLACEAAGSDSHVPTEYANW